MKFMKSIIGVLYILLKNINKHSYLGTAGGRIHTVLIFAFLNFINYLTISKLVKYLLDIQGFTKYELIISGSVIVFINFYFLYFKGRIDSILQAKKNLIWKDYLIFILYQSLTIAFFVIAIKQF